MITFEEILKNVNKSYVWEQSVSQTQFLVNLFSPWKHDLHEQMIKSLNLKCSKKT